MQPVRLLAVALACALGALAIRPADGAGMASIRVAHASPNAPAVDVYVDGVKAFSDAKFSQITPYARVASGAHHVQVFPAGAAPTGRGVIDATVNLTPGKTYTVAATGLLKQIAPLVLVDRNTAPAAMARVRFVHLSPDAPRVDVTVAGGATLFHGVAFDHATRYVTVPAKTYTILVRVTGTKTIALRVPNVRLAAGSVYTVFAEGLATGTPTLQAVLSTDHSGM